MVTNQEKKNIYFLKLIRLLHIGEMFMPFKHLIDCLMSNTITRKRQDMLKVIVLFYGCTYFGHLAACIWISIGTMEGGWLSTFTGVGSNQVIFEQYDPFKIYIFSLYWAFTVLTTVGFGDYTGH